MEFQQKLRNYAELIVRHGLNVQEGQVVNLSMDTVHRDLGIQIAEFCYQAKAKHVELELIDSRLSKVRIDHSGKEDLEYVPASLGVKYDEILNSNGANLKIVGAEYPDILSSSAPDKVNAIRMARYKSVKRFYDDGIGKSKVHWTVAAAATPEWGKKVFPDLNSEEAYEKLWNEIFHICRVDQPDFLALWKEHNQVLQDRAKLLSDKNIRFLHFEGPGTDLRVGLSKRAIFKGGGDVGPLGVEFEPNLPTEECFTTPDWRQTHGTVTATRPVMVNGVMVKDLNMTFESGELTKFTASAGYEAFEAYTNSDAGGKRLGEVALVGIDSPIYKSGLVYHEILFDENAACHIAVGSAYKFCLEGHETLSTDDLDEIGCNESSVHTDIMISSDQVSVRAESYSGETFTLLKGGSWCI